MRELVRFVERPRPCSYLSEETASLEYRIVEQMTASEYEGLLGRGYRRFGRQLFRPCCPGCRQCVSIRFLPQEFAPSASQRRVMRSNRHIEVRHERVNMTADHLTVYRRYHEFMAGHRGWHTDPISRVDYYESFVDGGGEFASQWLYLDEGRLVGVALMDETSEAISLVYFFHEPEWRQLSPGTFSVLTQMDYARRQGKTYAYPGYWIEANQSMAYKKRFRPFETLLAEPSDGELAEWLPARELGA